MPLGTYWNLSPSSSRFRNSSRDTTMANNLITQAALNQITTTLEDALKPSEEVFYDDPFEANINPATKRGQELFLQATKAVDSDKKLHVSVANSPEIVHHLATMTHQYAYGDQILNIPLAKSLTTTKSLITQSQTLTLDDIQLNAYKLWGSGTSTDTSIPAPADGDPPLKLVELNVTATSTDAEKKKFYRRVRSRMIAKKIDGLFDATTLKSLNIYSSQFEWITPSGKVERDGTTMWFCILRICKPSLKVDMTAQKALIRGATAEKYKNDVNAFLDAVVHAYDEITVKRGQTMDDFVECFFQGLKSFKNRDFHNHVCTKQTEWRASTDPDTRQSIDVLVADFRNLYVNLNSAKEWGVVDPADAKLLALSTQVSELQSQLAAAKSASYFTPANTSSSHKRQAPTKFDIRRTVHEGKTKFIDGVEYEYCDKGHHNHQSKGMYFVKGTHDHDAWQAKKDRYKKKKTESDNKPGSSTSTSTSSSTSKLVASDKLKTCMLSYTNYTEAEVDQLLSLAHDESKE